MSDVTETRVDAEEKEQGKIAYISYDKLVVRDRDILYWPNMNRDVYETVSQCDVCQEYRSISVIRLRQQ